MLPSLCSSSMAFGSRSGADDMAEVMTREMSFSHKIKFHRLPPCCMHTSTNTRTTMHAVVVISYRIISAISTAVLVAKVVCIPMDVSVISCYGAGELLQARYFRQVSRTQGDKYLNFLIHMYLGEASCLC
jgi:hypothetical protein